MRIAIAQTNIIFEDKAGNLERSIHFISEASNKNADMIVFPEMSFTGFSMHVDEIGDEKEETLTVMSELALQSKISILFGWVEKRGNKGKNHATLVTEDGTVCLDYVKIHPFSYAMEDKYYIPGDGVKTAERNGLKISTFICYDLRFPEVFQSVSKTADVMIVIANWPQKRVDHWNCLLRARAIENQSYVVGVNCVGWQNDLFYSGNSCVIDPSGYELICGNEEEKLLICDISHDVNEYRERFPVKKDRRTELYRSIL